MKKYAYIFFALLACNSPFLSAQTPVFNNNGALITVKSGAASIVYVDGSLDNMTNGTVDNAGHIITMQDYRNNGTTTGNGANALFEVKGNWENNSTFTAGQSTVLLNKVGNAPPLQQITGSQVSSFYNLDLDGNNVKRQTLDAFVTNNLDLKDCELRIDVNKTTMTKTLTNALSFTTGMVSARGTGQFAREMVATGGFYWFPTGDSVEGTYRYRPIQLRALADAQFGARMANVDATTESFSRASRETDICNVNPNFYHRLYRNTGNAAADIRYYYLPVDGIWERVGHWDGTPEWQKMPAPTNSTTGGFNMMAYTAWNDFSPTPFALISLLPIINAGNVQINPEYCGPTGSVQNITVGNVIPGTTYSWTDVNGNVVPGATSPNLTNVTTGTYTLHVNKPNGCDAVMTFNVGFVPTFTTDIIGKNLDCFKDKTGAANLSITGGFPQFTYNWSNGQQTQDLNNLNAGWYYVTVTDAKGCKVKDSVLLTQPPKLVATFDAKPETCNQQHGSIAVYPSGGTPGYQYSWEPNVSSSFMATNLLEGVYEVSVIDTNGCRVTKLVTVDGIPLPTTLFSAEPGVNIEVLVSNATFTFENQTQGATSYLWDFGDGNTSTLKNPSHSYSEPGEYFVTLTAYNSMGCSTTYVLSPLIVIPDGSIYIPNAFSPNDDGINDVFGVYGEGIVSFQMILFDRWGKEIATFNNPADRWDGKAHGKDAPEGAYTYKVDATLNNGKKLSRAGTVLIIR